MAIGANAKVYVSNIHNAMLSADPAGKITYEANAAAYLAKLDALDREVKAAIYAIPPERRRVISTHDAFGYFEQDYGIDFIAPQGVSTDSEPSARDIARIITQIKRLKIPAVFLENIVDPRLMQQIAKESGARDGRQALFRCADRRDGRGAELHRADAPQHQGVDRGVGGIGTRLSAVVLAQAGTP